MKKENNISAIIVVHNEERFIRKCLNSIKDVCAEIIITHDGKCQDNSLKIASEFTDKIFESKKCGSLESHLVDALYLSKYHWVLRLDVDEHLSEELIEHIRELDLTQGHFTHFKASWRSWQGGEVVKQSPYLQKVLIFNKKHSLSIAIPHQAVSCSGKSLLLNGYLEHTPDHLDYGFHELIFKKFKPLAKFDAKLRFASPVKTYPNHLTSLNPKRNIMRNKYPLLTMPVFACNTYAKSLFQLRTARCYSVFKIMFIFAHGHFAYQILLSYYLFLEKRRLRMESKKCSSVQATRLDYCKLYDEEYFERGLATGKSCYINYSWLPELTLRMFYYMVKDLPIEDDSKILDFGCAKGYLVRSARILDFDAYGVDVSEYAISQADSSIKSYCKLINNGEKVRGLFDITFDWVISKDVFEHIPEEALPGILQDLASVTKKMFLIIPISEDDDSGKFIVPEYDKDPTHFTIKSNKWWVDLFEENGLVIEQMSYNFRYCKHAWTSIWPKGNAFYILKSKISNCHFGEEDKQ